MFPIIRVDSRRAESLELLGTKRKFWYTDDEGRRMLFKAEERGTGEDWAEKVACELCALLGLPHVHYELAMDTQGEWPGMICETCAPPPVSLVLGNQLLLARDPSYPADESHRYKVKAHTVEAVTDVLNTLGLPPTHWLAGVPAGIGSALEVFVGYVMLDAWIANQDRHHENWGALRSDGALDLAPTFDHGASMARNLSDEERRERLTTKDRNRHVEPFVRRARSAFHADAEQARPMMTVDAWAAFAQKAPKAAKIWRDMLAGIDQAAVEGLLAKVPPQRMSHVCRKFTRRLLLANRERLLTGDDT